MLQNVNICLSGTHSFLITVLLVPGSTKIWFTLFSAILLLITAANGSSSTLICCTFFGQTFAKCPYSLLEKQCGPKLGSNLGLCHGFVPSSVCCFFPDFCSASLILLRLAFVLCLTDAHIRSGSLLSAGNVCFALAICCC